MGQRSIYITVDEKRKAQVKRNEQLKLNEEKYELKNKNDGERQQRNQKGKTLQRMIQYVARERCPREPSFNLRVTNNNF